MAVKDMAVYFDVLRQRRGITQQELATTLGVNKRLIQRWLTEGTNMKFDIWRRMVQALRADPSDAIKLMDDENATPDMARGMAMQLLGKEIRAEYAKNNAVNQNENERLLLQIIAELESHPDMIRPVIGLLSGLRSVPRPPRKPR